MINRIKLGERKFEINDDQLATVLLDAYGADKKPNRLKEKATEVIYFAHV